MIRLLILFLLGYLVFTWFRRLLRALGAPPPPPPEKTSRGEEMVRDPQCGTFLPRSDALNAQVRGETHHFCSPECRDAFRRKE